MIPHRLRGKFMGSVLASSMLSGCMGSSLPDITQDIHSQNMDNVSVASVTPQAPTAPSLSQKWLRLTNRTTVPIGHYEMCERELRGESLPVTCQFRTPDAAYVTLTDAVWAKMKQVNDDVNLSIEPIEDIKRYTDEHDERYRSGEYWTFGEQRGDCEEYVLEKLEQLVEAGFDRTSLLPAVVYRPDGEGHAVLIVRTDQGDFVLDNMVPSVLAWNDADLTFLKALSPYNARDWLDIDATGTNFIEDIVQRAGGQRIQSSTVEPLSAATLRP